MASARRKGLQQGAVTIKTVAAEAGVSIATVSRALAGSNAVAKEAHKRVIEAIRKLDYHPNHLARGLRAGRRKIIGVIIPDLQNPFFTGVVHGIESVLYESGYTLVLGHSNGLAERELAHIGILRSEGAAGLILMPDNASSANYESLSSWKIPAVAVDRIPQGIKADLISTNHRKGARDAINHLISHGYKDIALINGPHSISVSLERFLGYEEALKNAGAHVRDGLVIQSDFRHVGGYKAMKQLLELSKPPRAVMVANNLMTLGALQAIHESGFRVPEEIAIVGFDDLPWASTLRPPLTAMAQPIKELGEIAARTLLERLNNPDQLVRQIILPPQLIVRASCGIHPV
ncbi:MAG TPA: LacI family DNA-binding transcriptional regulator [Verrucomicrobiae bacterium]|nr:LacI family DNA-binding transcriptional regulator [Verrucomicrobiae bacterium]